MLEYLYNMVHFAKTSENKAQEESTKSEDNKMNNVVSQPPNLQISDERNHQEPENSDSEENIGVYRRKSKTPLKSNSPEKAIVPRITSQSLKKVINFNILPFAIV